MMPARIPDRTIMVQAGMTLVEMLVVLAIIGMAAGAAALALGSTHMGNGPDEAARLRANLQLAADDAMASDHALALSITPTAYAIVERADAGQPWQPASLGGLGVAHRLPAGMTLSSDARAAIVPIDADGATLPFSVTLSTGDRRWIVTFDGISAHVSEPEGHAG